MFRVKPYTYDTGEDMQLSFSCKVFGNIDSYVAEHKTMDDNCDIRGNMYAADEVASFRDPTSQDKRKNIEKMWIEKYSYNYIKQN